jgi:GTP-binding protein
LTREGVREMIGRVFQLLGEAPEAPPIEEDIPTYTLEEEDRFAFDIDRLDAHEWRVRGARIERAAQMTYWEYDEAILRFQRILESLGIYQALIDAGVEEGDVVHIGEHELEWQD